MKARVTAAFALSLLLAGMLWGAGFTVFNLHARQVAPPPEHADGIVVLTGGAERIETALRLLAGGRAPLLLISGVGRGADLAELTRRVDLAPGQAAQITLGHVATTTRGNADETAAWAQAHGVRSLIVVTAGYHMPRALLEIGRALPAVVLHPFPVQPPALRGGMEFATVRMMANEYDKYLVVRLGLDRHMPASPAVEGAGS